MIRFFNNSIIFCFVNNIFKDIFELFDIIISRYKNRYFKILKEYKITFYLQKLYPLKVLKFLIFIFVYPFLFFCLTLKNKDFTIKINNQTNFYN